ncbi:hypothetical protein LCGC14_3086470, partial [marine sediment metagenome]
HVIRTHPKYDVALIMVEIFFKDKTKVKGFAIAKPQDKLYLVGHHLGRPYTYGEGVFAGYDDDTKDNLIYDIIQIPTLFGNSGSAVFDKDGDVVSMAFHLWSLGNDLWDAMNRLSFPFKDEWGGELLDGVEYYHKGPWEK